MVTKEQLASIFHSADKADLAEICEPLNAAMKEFGIDTPARQAMFLAQCAHESGNFSTVEENLYYRAETLLKVFKKYYKTAADAAAHAKKPELIANRVYSSRMGNGDAASGDGYRYRGRGLIQLTGKDNYTTCGKALNVDLHKTPDYLETAEGASRSAAWFWSHNSLNKFADAGDILGCTKRINGGTNGLEDRTVHYNAAKKVLG
jgi:putative chitinase